MNMLTGGKVPVTMGFGFGSYDFTNDKFSYLGKKENKWYEDLGYGLGALSNISDIVTWYDDIQATKRVDQVSGLSDEELRKEWQKSRDSWLNKKASLKESSYAGISPSVNPEELLNAGIGLLDVDGSVGPGGIFGGYQHDLAYWKAGTDGARGAFFNNNVLQADKNLVFGMRQLIRSGNLTGPSLTAARNINIAFSGIVGYKMLIQHQYLLHFIRH